LVYQILLIFNLNWIANPPSPKDNFDEENNYWDSMIALKKINASDVRQVVQKRLWSSGTTFDMYRHDYSRSNTAKVSGATNLYSASYYVLNSDYRVYICLQNGTNPDNENGRPSLDEPLFTDLDPRVRQDLVVMDIFGNISILLNQLILLNLNLLILCLFL
jgi:hypothetical protein